MKGASMLHNQIRPKAHVKTDAGQFLALVLGVMGQGIGFRFFRRLNPQAQDHLLACVQLGLSTWLFTTHFRFKPSFFAPVSVRRCASPGGASSH